MTQSDAMNDAPEFQAADRDPKDLGWFRGLLARYRESFSVARASLLWVLLRRQKRTLKWLFIVLSLYSVGLLFIPEPHARNGRQRHRRPDGTALALRAVHRVLGPVVHGLRLHPAADRRTALVPDRVRSPRLAVHAHPVRRAPSPRRGGQRPTRHPFAHRRRARRDPPSDLSHAVRLHAHPHRRRRDRDHHQSDHGRADARRAAPQPLAAAPIPPRSARLELGGAQRASGGHRRHRRAGARHSRGQGLRPRRQGARPGRRRDRAGVQVLHEPRPAARSLRHRPEDVAHPRAGRAARSRDVDAGLRPTQRRDVPPRVPARHRLQPVRQRDGRPGQRVAVPPQCPGPTGRDARPERPARHRWPHDAAPLHRVRGP